MLLHFQFVVLDLDCPRGEGERGGLASSSVALVSCGDMFLLVVPWLLLVRLFKNFDVQSEYPSELRILILKIYYCVLSLEFLSGAFHMSQKCHNNLWLSMILKFKREK